MTSTARLSHVRWRAWIGTTTTGSSLVRCYCTGYPHHSFTLIRVCSSCEGWIWRASPYRNRGGADWACVAHDVSNAGTRDRCIHDVQPIITRKLHPAACCSNQVTSIWLLLQVAGKPPCYHKQPDRLRKFSSRKDPSANAAGRCASLHL